MKKIIFAALILWAGVIVITLLVKGYQLPPSSKIYTDEEMIRLAIERTMQRMLISAPVIEVAGEKDRWGNKVYESPVRIIPYKSVEHFLEENPDCCSVYKNNNGNFQSVTVYVNVFYIGDNGEIRKGDGKAKYFEYFQKNINPAITSDFIFESLANLVFNMVIRIFVILPFLLYSLLMLSVIHIKNKYKPKFFVPYIMFIILVTVISTRYMFVIFWYHLFILFTSVLLSIIFVILVNKFGRKGFTIFFVSGFLIITPFILPKVMFSFSGYCFEQNRYLTEQEKLDLVVEKVIANSQYSGKEEFYTQNPGCCELVDVFKDSVGEVFLTGSWPRAKNINIFARVFYIYDYDEHGFPLYKEDYYVVDNCGGVKFAEYNTWKRMGW